MHKWFCRAIVFGTLPLLSGAAPAPAPPAPAANRTAPSNSQPPTEAAQNASQLMQRNGGSLLRATLSAQPDPAQAQLNGVSYFAVPVPEPKVLKKHDLVTIIVREETDFSATGTSDLKKQMELDAKIEQFVRLSLEEFALKNTIGADQPEIKISGHNNFKGEATVDRTDTLTTRITAEVVDVKPNGTLVVQARAHTKFDEEETTMILSGTCRAEDVTADNTILSTQLHDKDVVKQHKGAVRDTTRRGLIPRLFEMIRLF
jgi:flagellar L-ring protein precursor FlgH